jgi:glycogen operon protein
MILHGDELNRTQGGNNNAYCQDNELTWIDWSLDTEDREFLEFTSALISLHARLAPLRNGSTADQLRWLTANGHRRDGALAPPSDAAGLCLDSGQNVLLLLGNAQRRDRLIRLPRQSWPGAWTRLLSTVEPGCRSLTGASYRLCARSISVLEFEPEGEGSD